MFVGGTHDFGSVDEYQQTSVATRFVHVWFVPIWPLHSVVKSSLCAPFLVPLVARSIVAGYLRMWGPLIAGAMALSVMTGKIPSAMGAVAAVLGAIVGVVGWTMGRLGRRAYAERQAYRRAIGIPVDPAILADADRRTTRARLLDEVERIHGDYRGATTVPWERLVLDPHLGVETLACLVALARIEETLSKGEEKARFRSMRQRLMDVLQPKFGV